MTDILDGIREREPDGLLLTHGCGAKIVITPEERAALLSRVEELEKIQRTLVRLGLRLSSEACGSVEYSDWPELQKAVEEWDIAIQGLEAEC